jgi:hypothetical protein
MNWKRFGVTCNVVTFANKLLGRWRCGWGYTIERDPEEIGLVDVDYI